MFYDYSVIKSDIKTERALETFQNICTLDIILLNSSWIKEEISYLSGIKMKIQHTKLVRCC